MDEFATLPSAGNLIDALGRDAVCTRLFPDTDRKKARKSLSQAIWQGSFPAKWFAVLSAMSEDAFVDCPMSLFRFDPDGSLKIDQTEMAAG